MAKEGRPTGLVAAEVSHAHPMGRIGAGQRGVSKRARACAQCTCHMHVGSCVMRGAMARRGRAGEQGRPPPRLYTVETSSR
eukprot:scaffold91773_cov22-Tisochrysis_lutea.AAC.1